MVFEVVTMGTLSAAGGAGTAGSAVGTCDTGAGAGFTLWSESKGLAPSSGLKVSPEALAAVTELLLELSTGTPFDVEAICEVAQAVVSFGGLVLCALVTSFGAAVLLVTAFLGAPCLVRVGPGDPGGTR